MTKPSKPRTGRKRQENQPAQNPSRESGGRPNGDSRQPSGSLPEGATAGGDAERASVGLFARARVVARNAPDVRPGVVKHYRRLLADGRYEPDLEAVAERLIREGLLDHFEK